MIDLDKLRLDKKRGLGIAAIAQKPVRHKRYNKFIKGPLPLDWFMQAAKLQGKAMNIALALWYLSGLNKTATIKLTHRILSNFDVSPRTSYRVLEQMEKAGLISVVRHQGRSPLVTLIASAVDMPIEEIEPSAQV